MSVDTLVAALRREAESQVEEARATARARCDRMVADAEAALRDAREAALARRRQDQARARTLAIEEVRVRHGSAVLAARHAFLERVRTAARALDPAVIASAAEWRSALAALLGEALDALPPGPVVVRCSAWTRALMNEVAWERPVRHEVVDDAPPGFEVCSEDGILVRQWLAERIDRSWRERCPGLVAMVAAGGEGAA